MSHETGDYRLPVRRRRAKLAERGLVKIFKAEENLPTSFDGEDVDSKEEARVGVGLYQIGYSFDFHVPVFGGRSVRGGQVLDFLVHTTPLWRPLYVQSAYWHHPTKSPDDSLGISLVRTRMAHYWGPPAEIWDYQATSIEAAIMKLLELFGRPG